MARESLSATEVQLLRARIEHWRSTRVKHTAMPEALWAEAARLARRYGVCPVSRALRISYDSLQRRGGAPEARRGSSARPAFVELSGAELTTAGPTPATPTANPTTAGEVVLEISDAIGLRLTLRLPPGHPLDLGALLATVRGLRA
jgi:hypothetical protein